MFSPGLIWFLLGIAFFFFELLLPGFILFFFGLGAWCVAIFLAFADVSQTIQMIVFIVTSLLSLALIRSRLHSIFVGDTTTNDGKFSAIQFQATTGVVTQAIIPPATGRVQYGGSFWSAKADQVLREGAVVMIVEKKGLMLTVRPLAEEKEDMP
jgi:membrane protein implicated in regulation of membrane protease activity